MFFYDYSCQAYCLFFRLVENEYVHLCLNWSKFLYGDYRCHVKETQPWWLTRCAARRATSRFSRQRSFLEKSSLREKFQLQQTNKRFHGENVEVFSLGTPKKAFLMGNLPTDAVIWPISPTNRVTPFNFQKRAEEVSPSPLVVCTC